MSNPGGNGESDESRFQFNSELLSEALEKADAEMSPAAFKQALLKIRDSLARSSDSPDALLSDPSEPSVSRKKSVLLEEIDQIVEARTPDRARYYLRRLLNSLQKSKTGKINDVDSLRWKEYDHILTDSLWVFDRRDSSGSHDGSYWGNYIPQIPRQLMLRYTKKGDWVLDMFLGGGTSLIECRRMGRNGIGIELNPEVARAAEERIEREANADGVTTKIAIGDSRSIDLGAALGEVRKEKVQLLLLHPPYHDIIRFSEDPDDLSNADSTDEFLSMFGQVVENATPYLEKGRYLAVVIGDKYVKGEWIPLGFLCMQAVLERPYRLKSIVVKNFEQTKGKRSQKELWRYRALIGGFYVFKHEYIFVFQKR